jgi:group I intron endonuclease
LKRCGIYAIINTVNGKTYVGSSVDVGHRFIAHRSMLRKGTHSSRSLQGAWRKHGEAAFRFDVIEECLREELLVREQHWIDHHRTTVPLYGYNGCPVAGTREGVPQPPSVAIKMRAFHLGKPKSAEHRAKISAARKGQRKSEEHKQKLRDAANRQYADPAARASAAEFGRLSRGGRGRLDQS